MRNAGAVVGERLAPAGLSRLLGSMARGAPVVATAASLFVAASLVLVLVPSPPVTVGLVFVIPVAIIATELGTRAGLFSAGLSIAIILAWQASGVVEDGPTAVLPRSIALVFLAWIIGRTSDRGARSRDLLEQVLEATTDSIYVKDLDGRYLLVNSAAAELIGRPGEEIVGRVNSEVLPDVARAIAEHDAAVLAARAPSTYEMSGHFGGHATSCRSRRARFATRPGPRSGRWASPVTSPSSSACRSASGARSRMRRSGWRWPTSTAASSTSTRRCARSRATRAPSCAARTFASVTHPDDVDADHAVMRALISGRDGSSTDEKRYLRPDGSAVWVARSVTLVRDADGTPLHFLDQIQDITERRRFERELRHLADHDPLTGLLNRRRFEQELDRARRRRRPLRPARRAARARPRSTSSDVNDTLGHNAGDELIVSVASLLRERLRDSDIIARLGGDEFAVLLPAHRCRRRGGRRARRSCGSSASARRRRRRARMGHHDERRRRAVHRRERSGEQMLIRADLAMYEAKEAGGDRIATGSTSRTRPIASTNP